MLEAVPDVMTFAATLARAFVASTGVILFSSKESSACRLSLTKAFGGT